MSQPFPLPALRRVQRLAAALLAGLALNLALPQLALAQAASEPATAPMPAAPLAGPAVARESVANPYGLQALWMQGDFVARATLIVMLIMSMGSWYIIFTKLYEQRKLMKSADAAAKSFWITGSVKDGIGTLEEGSAFRYVAQSGIDASEHHEGTLVEKIDLHTWVSMSVQRSMDNVNSRLQDGLAFLATVGSTAPFVGLFGTVWGIYNALTAIGISGQASIDKVAGPVGEALIMTAFGLAVAVPAVMGYNWLIRRNKSAMERVRAFAWRRPQRAAGRSARALGIEADWREPAMAMNSALARTAAKTQINATINTTPLVDVMLVLLIIFLITIPVVTQTSSCSCRRNATCRRRPSPRTSSSPSTATARSTGAWSHGRQRNPGRAAEGRSGEGAATRGAHPRRRRGALRKRRPRGRGLPARRHLQGRLHHRATARRASSAEDVERPQMAMNVGSGGDATTSRWWTSTRRR